MGCCFSPSFPFVPLRSPSFPFVPLRSPSFPFVPLSFPFVTLPRYYEWGDFKPRQVWYCFVAESLEEHILPACNAYWQKNGMPDKFVYSVAEVVRSITTYEDPYGVIGRLNERVCFKRCGCVDENGARRVCVPPRADYQCEREATLLKMRLATETEFKFQQLEAQEGQAVKLATDMAKRQV